MGKPGVSIVLPVRNAADTLDECLSSIQQQTYENYELIVIDDGSRDASAERVRQWAQADVRICLISQAAEGIVSALNRGLAAARAPLIARMDADDRMYPERLALQVAYLSQRSGVGLVASQVSLFPEAEVQAGFREYIRWQNACLTSEDILQELFVESPFAHPSVMYRREQVLKIGGYRHGDFPEDYDLWLRLAEAGVLMVKLPEVLLDWREGAGRLSRVDPRCSRAAFDRLRATYLEKHLRRNGHTRNRPLAYWGAGRKTRQRSALLIEKGFEPAAWIDVDERKVGNNLQGAPVVSPAWLAAQPQKPFVLSYVANHGARDEIACCLQAMGYCPGDDYLMIG